MISVITATYNSREKIPILVNSLRKQTRNKFEWIVADGGSRDGTLEYLNAIADLNIKIISEEDFGIYDALNRGIKTATGEYYLVLGDDDILYPEAIELYEINSKDSSADIVTAKIKSGNKIFDVKKGLAWFYVSSSYVSGHAVGSLFKKSLHEEFGYYSNKYPIAADQMFIMKVALSNKKIKKINDVVGVYGDCGVSSIDKIGIITETYRIMIDLKFNPIIQTILMFLRIIKSFINW